MSTNEVDISFDFPDLAAAGARIRAGLPGLIAATLQRQRAMIFDNEGAYHGRPRWEPLKHRKGQILFDTGKLSQSIGPSNRSTAKPGGKVGTIVILSDGIVTIGTDLPYAAIHNYGGTIPAHDIYVARNENTGRFRKTTKKTTVQEKISIPEVTIQIGRAHV